MTLTLDLPPGTERKLQELAAENGQDLADYTLSLILSHVQSCGGEDPEGNTDLLAEAVARMTSRSPEQLAEIRERSAGFARPGKPLPTGQTIFDAVIGKWPGQESDEEVTEALRRLS